jgi:flagellar biosynthetic protein FliR
MSIPISYPYTFFLLLIRFSAFMVTAPLFNQRTFPVLAKIGFAALLAFLIAPLNPVIEIPATDLLFLTFIIQEVLIGLLLGFVILLPILATGMIGQLISSAMGLSYASSISPIFDESLPSIGQLFTQLALLIFILLRADHMVLLGLKGLVAIAPPGQLLGEMMLNSGELLIDRVIYFTGQLWLVSLQLSLPVVGVILLADLALVLISRAMPRMNAFSLSLSLKILMGLVVVVLFFPHLWPQLLQEIDKTSQQMMVLFR